MDGPGQSVPDYLQAASSITADGYICEVSIEYAQMTALDFSAGNTIGIHPCIDDTDIDDGDTEYQMSWTGLAAHDQSMGFGHMLLSDAEPAAELEKTVLFAEDFEGLTLGPNIDEALAGDAVWTDTPPEGWSVDESGIPGLGLDATDGVTEWAGWAFTDKAWWIETAEDQDRSLFELGSGIVAVADPDEWDDDERLPIPISADPYDTWLTTPAIDITGIEAGTLELKFDSSWRPEFDDNYHQTASITASFDGGDPVDVMLWESDEASDNYKPYATNETVVVNLDAPADAKRVVLTFGLFDAGNDWWWAIDNIEVRAVIPEIIPVAPGTDGLMAYYVLDGDANDSSGNGIDGIITNADTGGLGDGGSVWVDDPERGTVISFNGTADGAYVRAGEIPQMTLTNDFTWAFWAKQKAENTADNDIILGNRMDENAVDFVPRQFIKFTPTKFEWHMNGNGDDNLEYEDIPADIWLHHAVVKDGDQLTYYRNGVKASSGMFTQPLDVPQPLFFGGDNEGSAGENWNGLMSEVCIYERALSAGEVQYLAGFRPSELVAAFAFGSRQLDCPTYNKRTVNYTIVHHASPESVQYDVARGYGYEVLYPTDSPYGDRGGYGIFGPFDDSANNRNEFPDELPEELYDSFIGAKSFLDECSAAVMGDMDTPCDVPEGIIFRVDVPNGLYRFVGAFGEADNRHAHRIIAEDGGSGPPENIGPNHVVLVSNHDQAQYDIGEIADDDPGDAVFARVGFDDKIPPPGDGVAPSPVFVNMDENGMPTNGAPRSPILEVTQGYIRIHQLQGNSNDGPGGSRDANGGDAVILELWKIEPDEAENLLANGSFEEDEPILDDPDWVQWCTWNPAEGAGSNVTIVDTDAADGARSLKVEPVGPENWHFILVNISFAADLSKNYTATFWAKADAARPLTVQMKASDNSVDAWGATGFDLTTEWAEYSYTSEVLHTDVKLEFLCAGSEVPFLLDLVSVVEAD
jgi:hypothetical protein